MYDVLQNDTVAFNQVKSEHLCIHVALKALPHFLNAVLSKGAVTLDFRLQNYFRACENGQQDLM